MTDPTVSEAPPASHIPDTHLGESNQSSSGNGSILSSLTGLPNIASAFPVLNSADRSKQANLDLNEDEDEDDSDEDDDDDNGGCELSHSSIFAVTNEPTKRDRLRHLKDKTKAAVKSGLRGETSDDTAADADGTDKDASTNGHKHKITRMLDSATPSITRVTSAIAHPKQAAKGKASGAVGTQISKLNEPSVDRETELKFVEAHEKRADAIANDDKQGRRDAEESIEVLTQRRRDLHIRMVMKQIDTVRTVRLRKIKFPKREDFLMRDEHGNVIKDNANIEQVDWLAWFSEVRAPFSHNAGIWWISYKSISSFVVYVYNLTGRVSSVGSLLFSRLDGPLY